MQTHCNFCGEEISTLRQCPYEGLCFADMNGQPITTIPKTGYKFKPRPKIKPIPVPTIKRIQTPIEPTAKLPKLKAKPVPPKKPRVVAFDIYGNEIGLYKNIPTAAKVMNLDPTVVFNNLHQRRKAGITETGYVFKYETEKLRKREARIIVRMAGDKEMGRYPTIADAAKRTGEPVHMIYDSCQGSYKNRKRIPFEFKYLIVKI